MSTEITPIPSDRDIIRICCNTPSYAGTPHGNRLVKLSDSVVVKFGIGVRKQEAENQAYAHRYVDGVTLYVPQVFRYFEVTYPDYAIGYLVMEFIDGTSLQELDLSLQPDIVNRTIEAMRHLRSIPIPKSQGPGPVGVAPAQGYLWSDNGAGPFRSVEDMEHWINTRLNVASQPSMSLGHYDLAMCHMDLVRRNIFLLSNSSICFVDWAFAGFFPAIFEVHIFRELYDHDEIWFDQLLNRLPPPSGDDELILGRLGIPAFVEMKYAMN